MMFKRLMYMTGGIVGVAVIIFITLFYKADRNLFKKNFNVESQLNVNKEVIQENASLRNYEAIQKPWEYRSEKLDFSITLPSTWKLIKENNEEVSFDNGTVILTIYAGGKKLIYPNFPFTPYTVSSIHNLIYRIIGGREYVGLYWGDDENDSDITQAVGFSLEPTSENSYNGKYYLINAFTRSGVMIADQILPITDTFSILPRNIDSSMLEKCELNEGVSFLYSSEWKFWLGGIGEARETKCDEVGQMRYFVLSLSKSLYDATGTIYLFSLSPQNVGLTKPISSLEDYIQQRTIQFEHNPIVRKFTIDGVNAILQRRGEVTFFYKDVLYGIQHEEIDDLVFEAFLNGIELR